MLAVVSPAKKLNFDLPAPDLPVTQPDLLEETRRLIPIMRDKSPAELMRLMGISRNLAELNHARFQSFRFPATASVARPAALAFKGDTYRGLHAEDFGPDDFDHAQAHLRILSGLYGVLRPLDLIQPHRLEMGTRLINERGGNLYDFWGTRPADALAAVQRAHDDPTLINLASQEYFRAVRRDRLAGPVITPVFKEERSGVLKVISFSAKRARGAMARFMIRERPARPEDLKAFDAEGYRFRPELSDTREWVFARTG